MEILKVKEKIPSSINSILISNYTKAKRNKRPDKIKQIVYPERDGKRMSDNTKQFNWIVKIKENLERLFANNQDVFIAGDLLWYPVEGNNKIRTAPDAMVVFGRPKGHRGSYKSWEESHIAPQVVFEILSPGNTAKEMKKKIKFYEKYGVKEYYEYNPDKIELKGWLRADNRLDNISEIQGWISPILNIKFEITKDDLYIFLPDGSPFLTTIELDQLRIKGIEAERLKTISAEEKAESERLRAISAEKKAETESLRAESERLRAISAEARSELLSKKLKELGIALYNEF
ncbi:MAG: Uma2 family endonuclease [Desulfobacterales bacterium]|nr:Uma2 family endonuclease [Desulfobacterales bacterium]